VGKDTLRVAIVGSRKYENRRKIKEFIYKLKTDKGADTIIVSGGCKTGADYYAKKYALEFEVDYSEFPPAHYSHNMHCVLPKFRYGKAFYKSNYHKRNAQIAEHCDVMVAFLPKGIVSKGTESALNEAKEKQKKYVIIN